MPTSVNIFNVYDEKVLKYLTLFLIVYGKKNGFMRFSELAWGLLIIRA